MGLPSSHGRLVCVAALLLAACPPPRALALSAARQAVMGARRLGARVGGEQRLAAHLSPVRLAPEVAKLGPESIKRLGEEIGDLEERDEARASALIHRALGRHYIPTERDREERDESFPWYGDGTQGIPAAPFPMPPPPIMSPPPPPEPPPEDPEMPHGSRAVLSPGSGVEPVIADAERMIKHVASPGSGVPLPFRCGGCCRDTERLRFRQTRAACIGCCSEDGAKAGRVADDTEGDDIPPFFKPPLGLGPEGDSVKLQEPGVCGGYNGCAACVGDRRCGWCEETARCTPGGPDEPKTGTCGEWSFSFCTALACTNYKVCHTCVSDPNCAWEVQSEPNTDQEEMDADMSPGVERCIPDLESTTDGPHGAFLVRSPVGKDVSTQHAQRLTAQHLEALYEMCEARGRRGIGQVHQEVPTPPTGGLPFPPDEKEASDTDGKGGEGAKELSTLKRQLEKLTERVENGEKERAALVSQNAALRHALDKREEQDVERDRDVGAAGKHGAPGTGEGDDDKHDTDSHTGDEHGGDDEEEKPDPESKQHGSGSLYYDSGNDPNRDDKHHDDEHRDGSGKDGDGKHGDGKDGDKDGDGKDGDDQDADDQDGDDASRHHHGGDDKDATGSRSKDHRHHH